MISLFNIKKTHGNYLGLTFFNSIKACRISKKYILDYTMNVKYLEYKYIVLELKNNIC